MNTLVEDGELRRLRAMADGSKPFETSGLWERLAAMEPKEVLKLPPHERLGVGYYEAAKRRAALIRGD